MGVLWERRWQRLRVRLWRFALKAGLLLLLLSLIIVLWPDNAHQPLQSLDLLDLRDNSIPIQVPLTLYNSGWLTLSLGEVRLRGMGFWREVEVLGWLSDLQPQLGPTALHTNRDKDQGKDQEEADDKLERLGERSVGPGQTEQLIVALAPDVGNGKQQLELRYRTALGIPYTLIIPLQVDGVFATGE